MKAYRHLILLSYLSLLFLGFSDNIRGPLYPDILNAFSLDNAQGSLFFSLASAMVLFGGALAGFFLNKWGRVRTLQVGLLLMTGALFGMWLSATFYILLVAVFFFGTAMGIMGVVQNVIVIESSPPAELQKWQSGLHSTYGFASLTAPLLVSFIHKFNPNWREAFLVAAILGLIIFLFTLTAKEHGQNLAASGDQQPPLKNKFEISYYATILAIYIATEILISTRLALFVRVERKWSFQDAANLNSLFFVGLLLGRLIFIFWRPRMSLKKQMIASLIATALAVISGVIVHPIGLAIAGLTMAPFYPLVMTAAGRLFSHSLNSVTSQAIGLSGITVVTMHTLVGILSDKASVGTALMVGPVFSLMALFMILFYKKLFFREIP